jgi:hypothetical protein
VIDFVFKFFYGLASAGNLTEGGNLEDPGVDARIIFKLSSRSGMGHGLDRSVAG